MAMCLRYEGFNRADDVVVAGATADVAGKLAANFAFARLWMLFEQLTDAHDHAGRAEAALQRVMVLKGRLNRMQAAGRRETLDGGDRRTVRHDGEHRAGFDGMAVDIDRTGAALRGVATDVRSGQTEIIPQQMDQQLAWFDRNNVAHAVDVDCHRVSLSLG